jgi:hypothetical protein
VSNKINDELIERVEELMEYWTGTMWERVLRRDLDTNDLEALQFHLVESYREMAIQENYPIQDMPDMRPTLNQIKKFKVVANENDCD